MERFFIRRWFEWFAVRFKRADSLGQLIRGSGGSLIARGLSAVLALLSTMALTNLLGPEYGDYAYAVTWMGVLVLIGRFGFNKSVIRFLAAYQGDEAWGLIRGLMRYCRQATYLISVCTALVAAGVAYLLSPILIEYYEGDAFVNAFYISLIALPLLAQLQINEGVLDGFMRVFQSQIALRMIRPFLIIALLFGLTYWTTLGRAPEAGADHITAEWGMVVNLMAISLALVVSGRLAWRAQPAAVRSTPPVYNKREWLGTSRDMMWTSGFNLVLSQVDILMLGAFIDTDSVAIYNVATKVAQLLIMALTATNAILHPIAAGLYNKGEKSELQRIVTIGASAVFLFGLAGGVVLFWGGAYIFPFFGAEYVASIPLLNILILGQLVNAFAGPALLLLNMTGHQRDAAKIMAICAGLNVLLNGILIPTVGVHGAAIATASTMVIWNVFAAAVVWKRLNLVSIALWRLPIRRK